MTDPTDPYAPPTAEVFDAEPAGEPLQPHFVVSVRKLWVMSLATLGFYCIYCFYKHWQAVMLSTAVKIRPLWRAVFAVFFTHDLFRRIDASATASAKAARVGWNHQAVATGVVATEVFSMVIDVGFLPAGGIVLEIVSWCMLPLQLVLIAKAQAVANLAAGDPGGVGNNRLTPLNWLAVLIGAGLWVLVISSYFIPEADW